MLNFELSGLVTKVVPHRKEASCPNGKMSRLFSAHQLSITQGRTLI